jgi:hypothetical protein
MKCGYWDDKAAVERSIENNFRDVSKYLGVRNLSMTEAIKDGLKKYSRVLINTGLAHMPLGERYLITKNNQAYFQSIKPHMSEVYQLAEIQNALPPDRRTISTYKGFGSTKVIYEYLKTAGISHREAIHHKMLPANRQN